MNKYVLDEKKYCEEKRNSLVIEYDTIKNKWINKNVNNYFEIDNLYNYFKKTKTQRNIIFNIDFSKQELTLKQADNMICMIKKLGRIKSLKDIKIFIHNIEGKSYYEQFVITSICVLNAKNKKEKYNYIYDSICDYLDDRVVKTNVCGFENDKCIAKRNTNCTMGCCHHFKNRYFGLLYEKDLHLCEYQENKRCTAKCITCKMYMCDTLRKKGHKFTINNVLTIKRYFNIIQKVIIISSFFTPKEKIMKKLLLFSV